MNGLNGLAADAKNLESLKGRAARDPQAKPRRPHNQSGSALNPPQPRARR